jgi:hypothetical protein
LNAYSRSISIRSDIFSFKFASFSIFFLIYSLFFLFKLSYLSVKKYFSSFSVKLISISIGYPSSVFISSLLLSIFFSSFILFLILLLFSIVLFLTYSFIVSFLIFSISFQLNPSKNSWFFISFKFLSPHLSLGFSFKNFLIKSTAELILPYIFLILSFINLFQSIFIFIILFLNSSCFFYIKW